MNILPDGGLDYDDELLAELDWVIASVHTSFNISGTQMTERVLAAVEHPLVDCVGHLSGRLINRRDPYEIDVEQIAEAAARTGTMLEINGNPNRRDLSERHARLAAEAGALICVNTDAHRVETMDNMRYGIGHGEARLADRRRRSPTRGLGGSSPGFASAPRTRNAAWSTRELVC